MLNEKQLLSRIALYTYLLHRGNYGSLLSFATLYDRREAFKEALGTLGILNPCSP